VGIMGKRNRRRNFTQTVDPMNDALRAASTLGMLERLAGIGHHADRAAFWKPFASMSGTSGLEAGLKELRKRVHEAGITKHVVSFLREQSSLCTVLGEEAKAVQYLKAASVGERLLSRNRRARFKNAPPVGRPWLTPSAGQVP
jgi:hypothetical protein